MDFFPPYSVWRDLVQRHLDVNVLLDQLGVMYYDKGEFDLVERVWIAMMLRDPDSTTLFQRAETYIADGDF
jgi:hypothetical protein